MTRRPSPAKHMYRQGDVFICQADAIPADTTPVPLDKGQTVLAYGEVTGHSHAIASKYAALVAKGAERYLKVDRSVFLRHEEHAPIQLPAGNYRVVIQREYEPEGVRNVVD